MWRQIRWHARRVELPLPAEVGLYEFCKENGDYANLVHVLLVLFIVLWKKFFSYLPLSILHFMKIYSSRGAIRGSSIICFSVEWPSYYNQSCLNLGLYFWSSWVVWKVLDLNVFLWPWRWIKSNIAMQNTSMNASVLHSRW